MHPLSRLLDHPRARDVVTLRITMARPWSVRVADRAAITVLTVTDGETTVTTTDGSTTLHPGDVALIRGPRPYTVGSGHVEEPTAVIHPDQHCTTAAGVTLHENMSHGLRRWGNDPAGPDSLVIAGYPGVSEAGRLVTDLLPESAHLPSGAVDPTLLDLMVRELGVDAPGQGTVLDRLVDVVLIAAIRAWIDRHHDTLPGWVGRTDPEVATALRLIHDEPDRPWTVAELARTAATSRAGLAARFTAQVGSPPIEYLTRWRLTLARDLLADPGNTLHTVAHRVGYGSAFALSTAFKRRYGLSPQHYRRELIGTAATVPRTGRITDVDGDRPDEELVGTA